MNNQDLDRFDVKLIGIIFNPQKRLIMLIKMLIPFLTDL